jgi:hypothetical protein
MHFGLRGRQEHSTMLWGDIELKNTADGTRYILLIFEFDIKLLLL